MSHRDDLNAEGLPDLQARLMRAPARMLVLDYDGTLAPFCVDPMRARPLPGVAEALAAIRDQTDTRLAILSGRRAADAARLLGVEGLPVVGSHGRERLDPGGELLVRPLSGAQQLAIQQARLRLERAGIAGRLERKQSGLAFHTRGLPAAEAEAREARVRRLWTDVARQAAADLACRDFNGGVELRATDVDKGTALAELLADAPGGTLCVYIGDDDTDEDAFCEAARRGGVGILVGDRGGPTAAGGRLPDCAAVLSFLRAWASLLA
jgi:trehalose-phosphatase